ncbi:MAG: glutamate N-acetyltransferase/amino-acid N-acetyltransferase [Candidatus Azotimanducaceae bacterium]
MAVGVFPQEFNVVPGVKLSACGCGIKSSSSGQEITDLVLFQFAATTKTAGIFTKSLFAAAPVEVGKRHLGVASPTFFLVNSGNANAGVGELGIEDALNCCNALSQLSGVRPEAIIPFSTGVIGERLPVEKITGAMDKLIADLSEDNWLEAALGIMTTDTQPKISSRQAEINGETITVTGIAKGSGMIQPNMATMLSYIASDVIASEETLKTCLKNAADKSFNRITVDSDTSTNDSCMLSATGVSGVDVDTDENARNQFAQMVNEVCLELAQGIIRDGEGATKFVAVEVGSSALQSDCLNIAYAIANSPLMKTALFASDANWGRLVMAIGKAPVDIDVNKLDIFLGDVQLMASGQKSVEYTEESGSEVMAKAEIVIRVELNAGELRETVWTSDLSHEYVRINAEYRT